MSTTVSADSADENSLRWIARILSIAWAYWALFWSLFVAVQLCPNNPSMWTILIPVMVLTCVMYLGAAIVASVWGREKLGGRVLVANGVLLFAQHIIFKMVVTGFSRHPADIIILLTITLPPLIAGTLFLKFHRISKPHEL